MVVADTYIKYLKPGKYEDEITVKTTIKDLTKASVVFEYEVTNRSNDILVTGNSKLASVSKDGKISSIPEEVRKSLQ